MGDPDPAPGERRRTLHGITWEQYETLPAATDHGQGTRPDDETAYRDALRA